MAIAEFPLAHDWHEAFEVTFPSLFPMPSSPYHILDLIAKLEEIRPLPPENPSGLKSSEWLTSDEYE